MKMRILAAAIAGLALAAAAGGAETQRTESVGVAPITAGDPAPRDSALRAAVQTAVTSAAAAMLPAGFEAPAPPEGRAEGEPNAWLAEKLGRDPFAYVTRFRILEDRGRRPATFASDPDVEFEYVVVAEVTTDLDAIRSRMEKLGLVGRGTSGGGARRLVLVIDGLATYQPLRILREALAADRSVRSVVPIEFTNRRAVLAVDADRDIDALLAELGRRAPAGLQIVTVDRGPTSATLLVDWKPQANPPSAGASGDRTAGD